jgi:hypothetical protein
LGVGQRRWWWQRPGNPWEPDNIRDDLQEYVADKLGEDDGVLIIDDTGLVSGMRPHPFLQHAPIIRIKHHAPSNEPMASGGTSAARHWSTR